MCDEAPNPAYRMTDNMKQALRISNECLDGDSEHGEVRWDADVTKQDGSSVARYDVLTMVAKEWPS